MSVIGGTPEGGGEIGWESPDFRRLAGFWKCFSEETWLPLLVPAPEDVDLWCLLVGPDGLPVDGFRFLWDEFEDVAPELESGLWDVEACA